jgi:hypothetical protein
LFDPYQKLTGTKYTPTAALAAASVVFIPLVLALSRPPGLNSILLAGVFSGSCLILAWLIWRKHSRLPIPSFETPSSRVK